MSRNYVVTLSLQLEFQHDMAYYKKTTTVSLQLYISVLWVYK